MKLNNTILLFGSQSGGSSLINTPGNVTDTPVVRDIARKRLVKVNPDVDAAKYKEKSQTDNSMFTGKRLRVQDIKYGYLISEHDNESSANTAMLARPYSRILRHEEPNQSSKNRNKTRKKVAENNPDVF